MVDVNLGSSDSVWTAFVDPQAAAFSFNVYSASKRHMRTTRPAVASWVSCSASTFIRPVARNVALEVGGGRTKFYSNIHVKVVIYGQHIRGGREQAIAAPRDLAVFRKDAIRTQIFGGSRNRHSGPPQIVARFALVSVHRTALPVTLRTNLETCPVVCAARRVSTVAVMP